MKWNKLIKAGSILSAVMIAVSSMGLQTMAESPYYKTVYVDASVSTSGDGTQARPFKTIQEAKKYVRTINQNMTGDIFIDIAPGEYFEGTLDFAREDNGFNGYDIIYGSSADERPTITGGKHITSKWTLADSDKNIYSAPYNADYMRQIYVNGERAELAKGGWYEYINESVSEKTDTGYITEDARMHGWRNISDVEFVFAELWTSARCRVTSTEILSDNRMKVTMGSMWRAIAVTKGNGKVTYPWYVQNAYELLDEPGEFYYDRAEKRIYYMPRKGEDMATAEVIVPVTEQLMTMIGSENVKIEHIRFEGLEFAHSALYEVDKRGGWNDSQDNIDYGVGTRPWFPTTVHIEYATNIDFLDCRFAHIGQSALNMDLGVNNCDVIGNEFYDLAAGAFTAGRVGNGLKMYEGNARIDTYNITFSNNFVHDVSNMYHASAAVSVGYISDSTFTHNEIGNAPYSGIHAHYGWDGWNTYGSAFTNVHIDDNYLYNTMHGTPINDGAAIYTLGATGGQHGNYNTVSRNYIRQSGITNGAGGIYNDQGSSYWEQRDNVVDFYDATKGPVAAELLWSNTWNTQQSFVNYYDTHTTENCNEIYDVGIESSAYNTTYVRERQWNDKAKEIIRNSGLEPEYRARLGGGKTEGFETLVLFNGEKKFINNGDFESRTMKLHLGETRYFTYEGQNTYGEVVPESEYKVTAKSLTPKIIDVTANSVTAKGRGEGILELTVTYDGDKKQVIEVSVMCGDDLKTVEYQDSTESLLIDAELNTKLVCTTEFGATVKADDYDVHYYSTNPEIATVDSKGKIRAIKEGTCDIVAVVTYDGVTVEGRRTLECKALKKFDTTGIDILDISPIFNNTDKWSVVGSGVVNNNKENSAIITTPGGRAMYMGESYHNQLLNVNARVTGPEDGWPTLVFGAQDPTVNPIGSTAHTYLIVVKPTEIELQRFTPGKTRTMFYGLYGGANGIYGRMPNTFMEYGKTYNIQFGAITQEDGNVRLIMNVDGYNVFDCIDSSDDKITKPGYFGCINQGSSGIWAFSPPEEAGLNPSDASAEGFDDIRGHWARSSINTLYTKGYISGKSANTFAPNDTITRAEFTAIITRMMEKVSNDGNTGLRDVSANAWYATAVNGAINAGLIDSQLIQNDCFNPNAFIRRDEMASMLVLAYRTFFGEYPVSADISNFADVDKIETWSIAHLKNAVGGGLMYGDDMGRLNPTGNATRAEAAAMLARMAKMMED